MGAKEADIPATAIVLFDADCGLCRGAVRFICERDPRAYFTFTPLNSDLGRRLRAQHATAGSTDRSATMLLVEHQRIFTRSTAVLRIARQLRPPWNRLYVLILLPQPLRDIVYRIIAALRYRTVGPSEAQLTTVCKQRVLE